MDIAIWLLVIIIIGNLLAEKISTIGYLICLILFPIISIGVPIYFCCIKDFSYGACLDRKKEQKRKEKEEQRKKGG